MSKLTDNEIIKACKNCLHYEACKGTYYSAKGDEDILHEFEGEMYGHSGCENFEDKDLINRQQAENERLQKLLDNKCDRCIEKERAEAVKELIEKLIDEYKDYTLADRVSIDLIFLSIKHIAKRMVGEK